MATLCFPFKQQAFTAFVWDIKLLRLLWTCQRLVKRKNFILNIQNNFNKKIFFQKLLIFDNNFD